MKVRIVSPGWETYTGFLAYMAEFKDGVSVNELTPAQIGRIGSTVQIVNDETGEQVGPSTVALAGVATELPKVEVLKTMDVVKAEEAESAEALRAAEAARKAEEAAALKEAEEKAKAAAGAPVIYSRLELEAIGANDGIAGLREIADPLDVKGRSISELIEAILEAQDKLTVV